MAPLTQRVVLTDKEDVTVSEAPATGVPPADTVSLMVRMLHEAFEGPAGPWTYFTDAAPGTGVFATIGGLSAAQASQPGGPGPTTIAAHVHHLRSSLALSTEALTGEAVSRDRSRTWTVSAVDESAWVHLQAGVRRAYETFRIAVETRGTWDEDALGVAFGAVAHAAYHLGAIRQRLPRRDSTGHQHSTR
jgi:hypothetical protein